jgi:hypothetical protein
VNSAGASAGRLPAHFDQLAPLGRGDAARFVFKHVDDLHRFPVVLAASRACLSRWPRMLPPRFVAALWAVCLAFGSAVGVQAVIANKLKALVGKVLGDDDDKLAVYITERQWHPSQEFRTRADGRVEMRLDTRGRKELIRWVFSWMPDMKVLAPKGLRDRVADKLWDGLRAQL